MKEQHNNIIRNKRLWWQVNTMMINHWLHHCSIFDTLSSVYLDHFCARKPLLPLSYLQDCPWQPQVILSYLVDCPWQPPFPIILNRLLMATTNPFIIFSRLSMKITISIMLFWKFFNSILTLSNLVDFTNQPSLCYPI